MVQRSYNAQSTRRGAIVAVLAGVGVSVLVAATLVVGTLDARLLDPDFYVRHLQRSGAFNRLSSVVVPRVARERAAVTFPTARPEVIDEIGIWARRLLTPDWLEGATRSGVTLALEYLQGARSDVTLTVAIADRLRAVAGVFEERLEESPLTTVAYERVTEYAARRIEELQETLPYGITTMAGTWVEALQTAAPEGFVAQHVGAGVGRLIAWIVGDTPHFSVTLPLAQQSREISRALAQVVKESDISTFLREAILAPALSSRIDERTLIPETTIAISREELLSVVETLLDTEWAREQKRVIAQAASDYLTLRSDTLALEVDLGPLRLLAAERLAQALEAKVKPWLATRPPCTSTGAARIVLGVASPLECEPRGRSAFAYQVLLGAYVREQVALQLAQEVPEQLSLSLEFIRSSISGEAWALVQRVRGWMRHGLVLDDSDIGLFLDAGNVSAAAIEGDGGRGHEAPLLPAIVARVRQGFVVKLDALADPRELEGPVEAARTALVWLDRMRAPVALMILILLIVIAVQGAVRARVRLRIASVALMIGALAAVLTARVGEEVAAREAARSASALEAPGLAVATVFELPRVAASMLREIGDSVELTSDGLLCVAIMFLGGSWFIRGPRRRDPSDKPQIRGIVRGRGMNSRDLLSREVVPDP